MLDKLFGTRPRIGYSLTYSKVKYEPQKFSIEFDVPQGVTLPQAYALAKAVVLVQSEQFVPNSAEIDPICQKVFGCTLKELGHCEGISETPTERPRRKKTRRSYDYEYDPITEQDVY